MRSLFCLLMAVVLFAVSASTANAASGCASCATRSTASASHSAHARHGLFANRPVRGFLGRVAHWRPFGLLRSRGCR